MRTVHLATAPLPLRVDPATFDAFNWCPSTTLEWRTPDAGIVLNDLDDTLPLRMAFVFRSPWDALPAELAWLHTGRDQATALGITHETALAPYAIDDATDQFHAHGRAPGSTLWLATDNLNALYWALHDWAHFHNHGPFTDRPSTELQCDAAALVWMWLNRAVIPLADARWETLRSAVLDNHLRLRASEPDTRCPPPELLASPTALHTLAAEIAP